MFPLWGFDGLLFLPPNLKLCLIKTARMHPNIICDLQFVQYRYRLHIKWVHLLYYAGMDTKDFNCFLNPCLFQCMMSSQSSKHFSKYDQQQWAAPCLKNDFPSMFLRAQYVVQMWWQSYSQAETSNLWGQRRSISGHMCHKSFVLLDPIGKDRKVWRVIMTTDS